MVWQKVSINSKNLHKDMSPSKKVNKCSNNRNPNNDQQGSNVEDTINWGINYNA